MEASEIITIERPGPPAIVAELQPLVVAARQFEVVDMDSDAECLTREKKLRVGEKMIEEHFAKAKKSASDAHKELVRSIAALTGPIKEARQIYFRKSDAWEEEERLKAADEERRLQALARKEEEERQLQSAIEAEDAGDTVQRDAIMEEEPDVPTITVAPAVAKVEGVSKRKTWSADVWDKRSLILYVAQHPEWDSLLDPNMPNLNRMAVSQREALRIPGVRAVSKSVRSTHG